MAAPDDAQRHREGVRASLDNVQNRLSGLVEQKRVLDAAIELCRRERDALQRQLYSYVTFDARGADTHYVLTSSVSSVLKLWVDEYNAEHIQGGFLALAQRANVAAKTVSIVIRELRQFTTFSTADRLLTAIGHEDVMRSLRIYTHGETKIPSPPFRHYEES